MTKLNYPHREFCRRDHRIIGNYLANGTWLRKLDCIVLKRFDIEELLGVKKINKQRLTWFMNDLAPWFPNQKAYSGSGSIINFPFHNIFKSPINVGSLFLSRVPIDKYLPTGTMGVEDRIKGMPRNSPKTSILIRRQFEFIIGRKRTRKFPSLLKMVTDTSLLASGLEDPNILFKLE